ncbi:hypothetical protein FALCPG4_010147 [Fusarium falciforme]
MSHFSTLPDNDGADSFDSDHETRDNVSFLKRMEPLQSDLILNQFKFQPCVEDPTTRAFNNKLQEIQAKDQKWYELGAEKYRQLRRSGKTALPGPVLLDSARSLAIPSREPGRTIPCRLLAPKGKPHGVFVHIHGGGWVLNDETSSDMYLQAIADSCNVTCVSVGYRLAPEHPFPAGPDDCEDAATWVVSHAEEMAGAPLTYIGGESAGACLAVLTTLRLLKSEAHASLRLKGLLLHYGAFNLELQPSTTLFRREPTLVLDEEMMLQFRKAYCPTKTETEFRTPEVSPFFADLNIRGLPPALFISGTEDCLLEDTVFMCTRWLMAGHEAILKLYPGSPHGFTMFRPELHENTAKAFRDVKKFIDLQIDTMCTSEE